MMFKYFSVSSRQVLTPDGRRGNPFFQFLSLFLLLFTFVTSLSAQDKKTNPNDDFIFSGQFQMRPELDGRDFSNLTYPLTFTSLKTRLGVEKSLFDNKLTVFVQFQDSRVFGEEPGLISNFKNTDLHQGFAIIRDLFNTPVWAQVGRFEMEYGTQRFIGSSQWNYISRSYDGFRAGYKNDAFFFDFFGFTAANSIGYLSVPKPDTLQYPYPSAVDPAVFTYGFWTKYKFLENQSIDLFGYWELNGKKSDSVNHDLLRTTTGLNYELKIGDFSALLEAAYQFGSANVVSRKNYKYKYNISATSDTTYAISKDSTSFNLYKNKEIAAYTASLRLKYAIGDFWLALQGDIMSGNKGTDKIGAYNSDYATKHGMYGFMDYFDYDLNQSTLGAGVNDYFFTFGYLDKEGTWYSTLDIHYFTSNQKYTTASGAELSKLGEEIDLAVRYKIYKGAAIEWLGGVFLPGDLMKEIYTINKGKPNEVIRQDPAFWSAIMLRVTI